MQPLSGLMNIGGLVTQGSDAKRRSVATRGLNDFIPLGFRACKTAGGTIPV